MSDLNTIVWFLGVLFLNMRYFIKSVFTTFVGFLWGDLYICRIRDKNGRKKNQ